MNGFRLALAQVNPVLGDLEHNLSLLKASARAARAAGASLWVSPELALCGYPPEDLLLRPDFIEACDRALADLAHSCPSGLTMIVGHPLARDGKLFNAASVICSQQVLSSYCKQALPNYDVFDELRYFSPGHQALVFEHGGKKIGVLICEDVWRDEPALQASQAGAEFLVVLNASPFHLNKTQERQERLASLARRLALPMAYVNMVGGQDELVFDGASLVVGAEGQCCGSWPAFETAMALIDCRADETGMLTLTACAGAAARSMSEEEQVYQALVLGVRDYVEKNRFPGVLVGLSGGIDSALTVCIAADALGPERVRAVMMPSPYTAQMSLDDSRELVRSLGVPYDEIPIQSAMDVMASLLAPHFKGRAADTTEENLQARLRGMVLMALSNKTGALVLTTGNKSEMAVGYCTLYGDMAGGFAVIKDVYKTLVYRVSRYRNSLGAVPVIPENILVRPPSAELRPDQTDQDSLPPYEILDAILLEVMERNTPPSQLLQRGVARADVERVVHLLKLAEYKRRQSPIGIRITPRGFGRDWRVPVTHRYREKF